MNWCILRASPLRNLSIARCKLHSILKYWCTGFAAVLSSVKERGRCSAGRGLYRLLRSVTKDSNPWSSITLFDENRPIMIGGRVSGTPLNVISYILQFYFAWVARWWDRLSSGQYMRSSALRLWCNIQQVCFLTGSFSQKSWIVLGFFVGAWAFSWTKSDQNERTKTWKKKTFGKICPLLSPDREATEKHSRGEQGKHPSIKAPPFQNVKNYFSFFKVYRRLLMCHESYGHFKAFFTHLYNRCQ